jgi:malate synthase
MSTWTYDGVSLHPPGVEGEARVLMPEAMAFVADLEREFRGARAELLRARAERRDRIAAGELPAFRADTAAVRAGDWKVPPAPPDLRDRRVEITGPTERKMLINALNSGARVFMADFEDANSPTWPNMVGGQANLIEAIDRTLAFESPDGRHYRLGEELATLVVRPRGWHLHERHMLVDGEPVSASLFDFGLHLFHNAERLLERGSGPYYYLPKLEGASEAALWNDVFTWAQERLGLARGTVRATVLIETVLAAFEMDEILHALGEHATGLNAGRWDYIFSAIKVFRERPDLVLPDRAQVTMTVPFMRAYTELLIATCHRRGAHALGGMAAFIPSRRDPEVNERALAEVRADKEREAADGCDGSWVAHPDLVPIVTEVFDSALGERPNQLERRREDVQVTAEQLLDLRVPGGEITSAGLRNDVSVGIRYLASWLGGNGAAAIFNLMEDAATAEIARAQVWQWVRQGVSTSDGEPVTRERVERVAEEELARLREEVGEEAFETGPYPEARELFAQVALAEDLPDFLTLPGYERLG